MQVDNSSKVAPGAVTGAIREAAQSTGTSFDYLLATARVESGLDPQAQASTSSARGLFQFIEQTWLATLKTVGSALGYGQYADAIVQTPSGQYEVPDPAARQQVLGLRDDPTANATMAGAFTRRNAEQLAERIGRDPTDGELYIAHFLGVGGAANLITLAATNPGASAADAFPSAAKTNRSIFYDRQGHARSTSEVYAELVGRYANARAATDPASSQGAPAAAFTASTLAQTQAAPADMGPKFQSLYRDDRAPISQVVRDLWTSRPQVAAALTASPQPVDAPSKEGPAALALFQDHPTNARGIFGRN